MNSRMIFVDHAASAVIDELRMSEYAKAEGFRLDLQSLKWRQSDDESFVMAAEEDGSLVATMRGEVIDTAAVLEKKLECPWDFSMDLEYPVLLLSRAATRSSLRSGGLNLVMRYWFLRFAMQKEIGAVVGTFVAGSPRENSLRAMGYRFFENVRGWQQSSYRSERPVHVVALNLREEGERALRYCEDRAGGTIERFSLSAPLPELKFVRSV